MSASSSAVRNKLCSRAKKDIIDPLIFETELKRYDNFPGVSPGVQGVLREKFRGPSLSDG